MQAPGGDRGRGVHSKTSSRVQRQGPLRRRGDQEGRRGEAAVAGPEQECGRGGRHACPRRPHVQGDAFWDVQRRCAWEWADYTRRGSLFFLYKPLDPS